MATTLQVYAAYAAACEEVERPTVILAMTVKGYGTSEAGEASNETHSLKKLDMKSLQAFAIALVCRSATKISSRCLLSTAEDSPEMRYMRERRAELGGHIPARRKNLVCVRHRPAARSPGS
ncbi:MAG: hypothetical protein CM15mP25_3740 [Gammaproteobacteria bacterium]|nr:MAG: hypothetical protein CM15mP25_3740 [Gammaproteobacteria bacterium]